MHTPAGFEPGHTCPPVLPADTLVFAFHDAKLLVSDRGPPTGDPAVDAPVRVPTWDELPAVADGRAVHYLGTLHGRACVSVALDAPGAADVAALPSGWHLAGLRSLFFVLAEPLLAVAGRAFQILEWDHTHRYCGRCSTPMHDKAGERARECPACGHTAYPRVSPAMMVLVTRGRELLLARAHRFPSGMFSALAGFVEPGETIEDCIRREVREEVGVSVGNPVYFGSQSWAFPHSLMIAFTAEYSGGALCPDGREIAEAHWFRADALPDMPPSLSIARHLIDATAARLRG